MLTLTTFDRNSLRQLEWASASGGYHGHDVVVTTVGSAPCSWTVSVDGAESRGWDDSESAAITAAFVALRELIAAADAA